LVAKLFKAIECSVILEGKGLVISGEGKHLRPTVCFHSTKRAARFKK
jgi:agmatine/peptidylarginine deiminase